MDFKTLSPAYLTSLGVIFCGALLIGTSTPWLLWLGWILLILALGLNVLACAMPPSSPRRTRLFLLRTATTPTT